MSLELTNLRLRVRQKHLDMGSGSGSSRERSEIARHCFFASLLLANIIQTVNARHATWICGFGFLSMSSFFKNIAGRQSLVDLTRGYMCIYARENMWYKSLVIPTKEKKPMSCFQRDTSAVHSEFIQFVFYAFLAL